MNLKLLCTITNNTALVPQFLDHYTQQGVTHFYFLHYASANKLNIPKKHQKYVTVLSTVLKEGKKNTDYNVLNPSETLRKLFVNESEWYMVADLDEFSVLRGKTLKLIDAIKQANSEGYNYLQGNFVDRLTLDKTLPLRLKKDIWEQFPNTLAITHEIAKGSNIKCVATKGNISLVPGHHCPSAHSKDVVKRASQKIDVHHFKWWGNVLERLHRRYYERTVLFQGGHTQELVRVCTYFNYKYLAQMLSGKPPPRLIKYYKDLI